MVEEIKPIMTGVFEPGPNNRLAVIIGFEAYFGFLSIVALPNKVDTLWNMIPQVLAFGFVKRSRYAALTTRHRLVILELSIGIDPTIAYHDTLKVDIAIVM